MSNVIPPMLSSTPPPMDDDNLDSDQDDDDEFTDFTSADLNYGIGISQPSKAPINILWMGNDNLVPSSPRENISFNSDSCPTDFQLNENEVILELQDSSSDLLEENETSDLSGESGSSPILQGDRRSPIIGEEDTSAVVQSPSLEPERTLPSVASSLCEPIATGFDHTASQIDIKNNLQIVIQTVEDINDFDKELSKSIPERKLDSPINDEFTDFHSNFTEFQADCGPTNGDLKLFPNFQLDKAVPAVTLGSKMSSISSSLDVITSRVSSDVIDMQEKTVSINGAISGDVTEQLTSDIDFSDAIDFTLRAESDLGLVLEEIDDVSSVTSDNWQSSETVDNCESAIRDQSHSDSEFDDFTAFESAEIISNALPNQHEGEDEFSAFTSSTSMFPASESDNASCWATQIPSVPAVSDDFDDDFDDFDDFETATIPAANNDQPPAGLDSMVTSLFPSQSAASVHEVAAVTLRMIDASAVWQNLQDVDTSNALSYQWNSSSTNKMLLTSLGIDARNILFGPKWNISVPRFAANLSISPLEPVRASSPPPLLPTREPPSSQPAPLPNTTSRSEVVVPDAQFDWTSSGLVNPLDYVEKRGERSTSQQHSAINDGQPQQRLLNAGQSGLSVEALKLLDSLPDLSFLRAKSLVYPQHTRQSKSHC